MYKGIITTSLYLRKKYSLSRQEDVVLPALTSLLVIK